ncbi:MAG: NRDE family protein [Actinomycetota bacterium]
MCTVLLRFAPGDRWPLLLGAIRDEFADRPWDPPGRHWDGAWADLIGGRDRLAGGTWLAVDPTPGNPGVAALLNGLRRPPPPSGTTRPTRGTLALEALASDWRPTPEGSVDYDGFHLLTARLDRVDVWSWDGETFAHNRLPPGDHILVNLGIDTEADPLVPHFEPLLAATPTPPLGRGALSGAAWAGWITLLDGDGLDPADPRALIVRREIEGRTYASTSASLVALSRDHTRYDFNPEPDVVERWKEVGSHERSASSTA